VQVAFDVMNDFLQLLAAKYPLIVRR